jgi:hypothetical protein
LGTFARSQAKFCHSPFVELSLPVWGQAEIVSFKIVDDWNPKETLMQVTVKKSAHRISTNNGRQTAREPIPPDDSVDFSIFGAKEIRDVLKNKAHCLRAGFPPNHIIIQTFDEIRDHYILRVGLRTYLSQMLGEVATVPMQYCKLYTASSRCIELSLNGNHNQPVQRFIAKQFGRDSLPFKVEVHRDPLSDRVDVRYL